MLNLFKKIYEIERGIRDSSDLSEREAAREQIRSYAMRLREYVDAECLKVLPKSPIGKAMTYTINQWPKIMAIFEDVQLELDNNKIENKIRPLALGRKNYLFAGSHDAAQRIAMMYSFMASCQAKGVNPHTWLKETLDQVATTKLSELYRLLP